ncbi:hypothetical protein JCM8202_000942 [Rhodotorula sphaerocarpa]
MPIPEYRVVVMGAGGVGKSAITIRFVHQMFVEKYDPTIEDSYRRNVSVDGITISLEVLDTAGQELYMSLSSMYIRGGDGFLLIFSLTSAESLSALQSVREQVERVKLATATTTSSRPQIPLVLVGNKLDLVQDRQVSRDEAVAVSKGWGGVPYYETSARKEINVNEIFEDVVRQMVKADHALSRTERTQRNNSRKKKCTIL